MRKLVFVVSLAVAGLAVWMLRPRPAPRVDVTADAGVLLGVVLGPDGGAVFGAEVRGYPLRPVGLLACVDPDGGFGSQCPPPTCLVGDEIAALAAHPVEPSGSHAVTRLDGTFSLPFVEAGEEMRVTVSAPGVGSASTVSQPGEPLEVTLVESEPHQVEGLVVDEHGQPRAGVPVLAFDDDGVRLQRVVTDAIGRYSVTVPDGDWSVVAALPGLGPSELLDVAPGWDVDTTLVVAPRPMVRGQVVRDGTPVAGAEVLARGACTYAQRTEADGRFAFPLARGEWTLRASAPRGEVSLKLMLSAGTEPAPVSLSLGSPSGVRGVIVDEHERPITTAGAWCAERRRKVINFGYIFEPDAVNDRERVDAGGDFVLSEYGAGGCDLVAVAPGYVKELTPVKWRDGEVTQVKVVLQAGAPVTIKAVDPRGKPLQGVDLLWPRCPPDGGHCDKTLLGTTGEDGRVTTLALKAGAEALVLGGDGLMETPVNVTAPSTTDVVVTMRNTAWVTGRIVDAHGAPARGVAVALEGPRVFIARNPVMVPTDEDGVFRAECSRPGAWRLTATSSDEQEVTTAVASATFSLSGANLDLHRLQLGRGLKLAGVVRDQEGRVVANARVWAVPRRGSDDETSTPLASPGDGAQALTDTMGAFVLYGLEARAYFVWAEVEVGRQRSRTKPLVVQGGAADAVLLGFAR
jgi:hypothetical protein